MRPRLTDTMTGRGYVRPALPWSHRCACQVRQAFCRAPKQGLPCALSAGIGTWAARFSAPPPPDEPTTQQRHGEDICSATPLAIAHALGE